MNTKFAPYDDRDIWDLDEDEVFECFHHWLWKSLTDQELKEFEQSYKFMKLALHWHLNMLSDDIYYADFIIDYAANVFLDDRVWEDASLSYHAKSYELAKIMYLDKGLKKYVERIVDGSHQLYDIQLSSAKRVYLKEALGYAKNFHPGYLPEHLLTR